MEYRCPQDDRIFETLTDHRKPGAPASGKFPAHPTNGHPDCDGPLCTAAMSKKTAGTSSSTTSTVRVNRNAGAVSR
jgi:hypothetical protein